MQEVPGQKQGFRPNSHRTRDATRRAHNLECFSFDIACMQCEHSHWWQQVPFASCCITHPVWIRHQRARICPPTLQTKLTHSASCPVRPLASSPQNPRPWFLSRALTYGCASPAVNETVSALCWPRLVHSRRRKLHRRRVLVLEDAVLQVHERVVVVPVICTGLSVGLKPKCLRT